MRTRPSRWAFRLAPCLWLALASVPPAAAQYTLYYGNFHSHCNLSDDASGPLSGPPGTAYQYARDVAHIDVLALTDHTHYMSASEYAQLQAAGDAWTTNGVFIAISAQEHGSLSTTEPGAFGHINVWESPTLIDQGLYRYNLHGTYGWIASHVDDTIGAPLVASFNHPYTGSGQGIWDQFAHFAYDPAGATAMKFVEVLNGKRSASYETEYFTALARGWRTGALGNQDNHEGGWGDQQNNQGKIPLTGIWAPALTKADILQALAARRTFAMEVSPPTDRMQLQFTSEGHWMGSEFSTAADSVHFQAIASAETNLASLQLYRNGVFLKSIGAGGTSATWSTFDTPGPGDFWYVMKLNQADGDHAWSSPVWIHSTSSFSLPIAAVNQDDANGFPTLWFQTVTVQGIVTVPTGALSPTDNIVYLQDPTGGMLMQQFGQQTVHLVEGDDVLVRGTVDTYQGQTFLSAPTSIQILSQGGEPPTPVVLTTNDLATSGETWENQFVELRYVAITGGTWPAPGFDGEVTIDDGSGPVSLLIDKDTTLDDQGAPADSTFWVHGVVVQRDAAPPYTCCWEVLPRFASDIFQPVGVGVSELPSHHATQATVLLPTRPNPVRSFTTVRFDLAGRAAQPVSVDVFDVSGRRIRTLVNSALAPGQYEASWDARAESGRRVAAGVYFVRLVTRDVDQTQKVVVLQ
ncbi:MAG: FlgD immunoglobulin-like domain containing protein [bacterium]